MNNDEIINEFNYFVIYFGSITNCVGKTAIGPHPLTPSP